MKVKHQVCNVNWNNPKKPTCMVVLTKPGYMPRIFKVRIRDIPNFFFQKQGAL